MFRSSDAVDRSEKGIQRERGTGDEIDGATGGEGNTLKQRENTHSN